AANVTDLRLLQQRARAFVLDQMVAPASLEWLARFVDFVDTAILARIGHLTGLPDGDFCWCFYGASGRQESLVSAAPSTMVILSDPAQHGPFAAWYARVQDALTECDYLPVADSEFDARASCASVAEWMDRFGNWVKNPVMSEMYRARTLFDLRPVYGQKSLWRQVEEGVKTDICQKKQFLHLLANDCMACLPPLTFFQDMVVEESGEHAALFHLERNALRPLVAVGRVFGIAAGRVPGGSVLGGSTLQRFALARTLLPEHESVFRQAAETLAVLLYQQARAGIRQHSDGAELQPALLSRHDRQILKSGFRSILGLIQFTTDLKWLEAL
ncbi:MAG: putative nucleotidyltransferase substrate binding domain-containing protein, partial [Bryobacteraceae bacterium]